MLHFFQELMAMREERSDLRAQFFVLEREKKTLDLAMASQKAQETALRSHVQHLQREIRTARKKVR